MALPVVIIRITSGEIQTRFKPDGTGFATLVSYWSSRSPLDPPNILTGGALWALGDATFVTHILYRIVERDEDTLPDDVRDAILTDTTQREDDWYDYVDPDGIIMNIRYRDFVFPAVNGTDATITNTTSIERQHAVIPMMSDGLVLDAKTQCYWITAWLGLDADNILTGYDTTP